MTAEHVSKHYELPTGVIFNAYPENKDSFPQERYTELLERLVELTSSQGMHAYSESRTMVGYLAELAQLRDLAQFEGRLTIAGVNLRMFYLPTPEDELSKYGRAPAMPNTGNPNAS